MVHVMEADISGQISDLGQLRFVSVEWWEESPRFALLRYSMGEGVEPLGLRMDMDKKAVLDRVENKFIDDAIREKSQEIWKVVAERQHEVD